MREQQFVEFLVDLIKRTGASESSTPLLKDLKLLANDIPKFYANINNIDYLQRYAALRRQGDINVVDKEILLSPDLWGQQNWQSFVYLAKVLPELKKEFPDELKYVFRNGKILKPAGLDKRDDPYADTVYNYVERISGSSESKQKGGAETRVAKELSKQLSRLNSDQLNSLGINKQKLDTLSQFILKAVQGLK